MLRVFLPVLAASAPEAPEAEVAVALQGATVALRFRHRDGQWEAPEPADGSQPALTVEGDDSSVLLFALGRIGADDRRLTLSGTRPSPADSSPGSRAPDAGWLVRRLRRPTDSARRTPLPLA